jgi:hypothetical protein
LIVLMLYVGPGKFYTGNGNIGANDLCPSLL